MLPSKTITLTKLVECYALLEVNHDKIWIAAAQLPPMTLEARKNVLVCQKRCRKLLIVQELLTCGMSRQYVTTELLGSGTSGKVLRATCNQREVALKILKRRRNGGLEILTQSKLHHDHIVEFHRSFTFEGHTCVVLQLCENNSLYDMLRNRRIFTDPEVCIYTIQIAGALKYMHSKNIIHRDLKLGNIGLDANMNIKIGDFGLASFLQSRLFSACGTLNYMAPEVLQPGEKGYDGGVDFWSLGVIIYALLVGELPFQGDDDETTMRHILERKLQWPGASDQPVTEGAKELVAGILVRNDIRPQPDKIVNHPFIRDGQYLEGISSQCRFYPPASPMHGPARDLLLRQRYCQLAGVGRQDNGEFWPCAGREECLDGIGDRTEGTWMTLPFKWKKLTSRRIPG